MNREIILEKEVLREVSANLLSRINKYIIKNNPGADEKIIEYKNEVLDISNSIFGIRYKTMEELNQVNNRLTEIYNAIEGIVNWYGLYKRGI